MTEYFDELETRDPEAREQALFENFPAFVSDVQSRIPSWKSRLENIDVGTLTNRQALSTIPVLRKPELMDAQSQEPPFGGFVDLNLLNGNRIFMSPGPVWEPQAPGIDPWLAARSLYAAGLRKGDIAHCSIGFTLTPGGAILDEGIRALGAITFPAGIGNTDTQVDAISTLKANAYVGTPDYLATLLDRAKELNKDVSSLTKAFVSGGALFPSMREAYAQQGVQVLQGYATADIGAIAHETICDGEIVEGMILNENLILEIVRPGTDDPVENGEVGEIVITCFNKAYPLIRFGTGDLSAIIEETSPCGRTNTRIKGWMGRADQRTKIKGMFVDPKQVDQVIKQSEGVTKAKLLVTRVDNADVMTLQVSGTNINQAEVNSKLNEITKLKGTVEIVDAIPNDGIVIDDKRDYDA